MISAKMATLGLLKIKVFGNKGYEVMICVHDVTNNIWSRYSNYIIDAITWPKFSNSTICMILITTQVKTFSHPYISYMANDRLQRDKQFHSKNYLLQMPRSHPQNAFEKYTTKTELCNGKSYIKKSYTRL